MPAATSSLVPPPPRLHEVMGLCLPSQAGSKPRSPPPITVPLSWLLKLSELLFPDCNGGEGGGAVHIQLLEMVFVKSGGFFPCT